MPIHDQFFRSVETFLASTKMSATRFGREALNDPAFVFDLRNGRSPTASTMDRVAKFIATRSDAMDRAA